MASALRVNEKVLGGGVIQDTTSLQSQAAAYGRGVLPARGVTFTHGTGNSQANLWYLAQRTLAATTFDLIDLAGSLTGYNGATLTFTKLKRAYISIVSPDGTKSLRVGPQNQSNAAALGWGGTGATVYHTTLTDFELIHPYGGWTITAGTGDIFPVYNPGAGDVTYAIWFLGLS